MSSGTSSSRLLASFVFFRLTGMLNGKTRRVSKLFERPSLHDVIRWEEPLKSSLDWRRSQIHHLEILVSLNSFMYRNLQQYVRGYSS